MQAHKYPKPFVYAQKLKESKRLPRPTEEIQEAIDKGIDKTESFIGQKIRPRREETRLVLAKGTYKLPTLPTIDIEVEGLPKDYYEVNEQYGLIFARGFGVPYTISYEVGYRDGDLPSSIILLMDRLIWAELTGETSDPKELAAFVKTIEGVRRQRELERDGLATS